MFNNSVVSIISFIVEHDKKKLATSPNKAAIKCPVVSSNLASPQQLEVEQ